jgi:hypothetical protein
LRTTHLSRRAGVVAALALMAGVTPPVLGQDTIATPRHVLSLDVSRVRPFTRSYDMVVHVGDSAHVIGQRDVSLSESMYAGQPAWLLIETRTGIVPSIDSLFLAPDIRPIHWSSELGRSRFGAEFSGDSIFGATVTPSARRSLILGSRPDMLVSTAMIETIAGLLPLTADWSDSAVVLAVDAGDANVIPAELAITGSETSATDTSGVWILAVRTDRGQLQLWIEKSTLQAVRVEQALPAHVGTRLEFRTRMQSGATPP